MKNRVLVIDDENTIRMSLKVGLSDLGYNVSTAQDGGEAIGIIKTFKPVVVFLDMRLKEENGLELVPKIKEIDNDIQVVIMTAYGDIQTAVKAIKIGAFDYINKPFDLQEVQIIIERIIQNTKLKNKVYLLEQEKDSQQPFIYGDHPSMREIYSKISKLAKSNGVTVLITGETGTGKELVASAIHSSSPRKDFPMLKINCGAIPEQLIESELFGYEKSAFTGASQRKKGLLEIADGGTIFLDEIGELPLNVQPKLLRFLEERRFKRVGGLEDIEVDIRIMAATNKNLKEAIEKKEFREDLYYRLNVVPLQIPPLRDRGDDVILIAEYFLKEYSRKFHKNIKGFTEGAKTAMRTYPWKGNVRELKNVIERMVILGEGEFIYSHDLPFEVEIEMDDSGERDTDQVKNCKLEDRIIHNNFSLEDEVQRLEVKYIKLALNQSNNNLSKAAEILGMSRFALKRRIEKYLLG